jgi:cytochrome c oxidase cbb3-type subunit 3
VRAVILTALLALAACDRLPGKPTEADRPLRPDQVVNFDQLYGDNCSGCHGGDGTFGAAQPLNDPVYLNLAGADQLRAVTAQGVPNSLMPGFSTAAGGTLTDQQIAIIVAGMLSRWGGGNRLNGVTLPAYARRAPGDAQRGGADYATYCAGCHGTDGTGGKTGGSIIDGSYLALASDQALRTAVICGRPDLGMPDWRADMPGRALTDDEISDVVAWMLAQRPQFPGQPYQ